MQYPMLRVPSASREMLDAFGGYNHNLRIGDGEFYDMQNLTSDYYPVLSPRGQRGVYVHPESGCTGMIAKDALCYVDGSAFVINEYRVEMDLSEEPKQLISMGAYVVILPDKKWINTLDLSQYGSIEAEFTTQEEVNLELCSLTGDLYTEAVKSDTAPEEPANLALWIDTSSTPHVLKQYSENSGMWVSIATTYIKISSAGIGMEFEKYDGVTISGIGEDGPQALNASMVIWEKDVDFIVVVGILDEIYTQNGITVKREMPEMDYVIESGNRLWGCRYGKALNGEVVNELYCSKLGDFKNWNCFMGISTDSWVGSLGTDGQFTGAISHLGYPLFFKENCLHKVYISSAGAHQVQDTVCRGVQKDCNKSLAIVGETLFYKAQSGIMAYDGSLPVECSAVLGNVQYSNAVGGALGNKYYVSMQDSAAGWHLFVYDTAKGMWHREDTLQVKEFCACRGELYAACEDGILTVLGSGTKDTAPVQWMAQTGQVGLSNPDMKYISRLLIRLQLDPGAVLRIFVQYDLSGEWLPICTLTGTSLRSFSLPVRPRRCDHLALRFEGTGNAKLYSITKTIEQGSDRS